MSSASTSLWWCSLATLLLVQICDGAVVLLTKEPQFLVLEESTASLRLSNLCVRGRSCLCYRGLQSTSVLAPLPCGPDAVFHCFEALPNRNAMKITFGARTEVLPATTKTQLELSSTGLSAPLLTGNASLGTYPPSLFHVLDAEGRATPTQAMAVFFLPGADCDGAKADLTGAQLQTVDASNIAVSDYVYVGELSRTLTSYFLMNSAIIQIHTKTASSHSFTFCICYSSNNAEIVHPQLLCPEVSEPMAQFCVSVNRDVVTMTGQNRDSKVTTTRSSGAVALTLYNFDEHGQLDVGEAESRDGVTVRPWRTRTGFRNGSAVPEDVIDLALVTHDHVQVFVSGLVRGSILDEPHAL